MESGTSVGMEVKWCLRDRRSAEQNTSVDRECEKWNGKKYNHEESNSQSGHESNREVLGATTRQDLLGHL